MTKRTVKIATIIGTRPNFIKAAPVTKALKEFPGFHEVIIHTGQHYSPGMDSIFFEQLNIAPPQYRCASADIPSPAVIGSMVEQLCPMLQDIAPDKVLVYGDTNSSAAGGVAASMLGLALVHVEAGLRSNNLAMQEERNRILLDRLGDVLFCPTRTAMRNTEQEGLCAGKTVVQSGDVMLDAARHFRPLAKPPAVFSGAPPSFILVTIHRAENTDDKKKLLDIFSGLELIAQNHRVVLPLHPRTRSRLDEVNFEYDQSALQFIPPVGYLEMLWLLEHCSLVLTDGGGLQKEAYFHAKPCVTVRTETEWLELVQAGANILAPNGKHEIVEATESMLAASIDYSHQFYGNGHASTFIAETLSD